MLEIAALYVLLAFVRIVSEIHCSITSKHCVTLWRPLDSALLCSFALFFSELVPRETIKSVFARPLHMCSCVCEWRCFLSVSVPALPVRIAFEIVNELPYWNWNYISVMRLKWIRNRPDLVLKAWKFKVWNRCDRRPFRHSWREHEYTSTE